MIRRAFRKGLTLGILAALVAAAFRAVQGRRGGPLSPLPATGAWAPAPAPSGGASRTPLAPAPLGATTVGLDVVAAPGPDPPPSRVAATAGATTWLAPVERGCPASHPVKVRLASGIFHLPGMLDYERTKPDRCYVDATTAESDGFRPAMR